MSRELPESLNISKLDTEYESMLMNFKNICSTKGKAEKEGTDLTISMFSFQ